MDHFQQGDVVRVLDDIAKVHNLQENHGGWVDDMALVRRERECVRTFRIHTPFFFTVSWPSWSNSEGLSNW